VGRLLEKYAQLQLLKRIHGGTLTLAVSRSVVYELRRLGINVPMLVVDPGNGVDPCVSGGDRDIDVVFYSRITQEKGALDFMRIVRALSRLRRLRVVMMGWGGGALVDLLKKMNPGNVEFRLNVDRDEAMRTLAASKVMIYPTMLDAYPLVILEALSCGTPVIAHDIPAVRFNFNTRAVVKVRPLDYRSFIEATLKLLDSDLRELSTEAYNFAGRITWDEVVRSEWNALGKVLEYWERFPHQNHVATPWG
jgi:glycosyltransferase involved in cell wall biosynthesis